MSDVSDLTLWTIGHSTRTLPDFLELLKRHRIEAVGDVRSFPGSRRYPHFNAQELEPSLGKVGILYAPLKKLGGRRKPGADSPHTVWRNASFRAYADYMDTAEFRSGIDELLGLAKAKRTAIMCSEAVWWRCHRSMIADYLKSLGITVEHIMDGKEDVIHPYTSAAGIINGRLVYGAA